MIHEEKATYTGGENISQLHFFTLETTKGSQSISVNIAQREIEIIALSIYQEEYEQGQLVETLDEFTKRITDSVDRKGIDPKNIMIVEISSSVPLPRNFRPLPTSKYYSVKLEYIYARIETYRHIYVTDITNLDTIIELLKKY